MNARWFVIRIIIVCVPWPLSLSLFLFVTHSHRHYLVLATSTHWTDPGGPTSACDTPLCADEENIFPKKKQNLFIYFICYRDVFIYMCFSSLARARALVLSPPHWVFFFLFFFFCFYFWLKSSISFLVFVICLRTVWSYFQLCSLALWLCVSSSFWSLCHTLSTRFVRFFFTVSTDTNEASTVFVYLIEKLEDFFFFFSKMYSVWIEMSHSHLWCRWRIK